MLAPILEGGSEVTCCCDPLPPPGFMVRAARATKAGESARVSNATGATLVEPVPAGTDAGSRP
jgi:hypothetical protein